ncbi:protocadherin beta-16-like isoform X7 [Oncorhynchus tshawytscha]|uniref:protocadherin beta-16-like isoform X7 n=1 Tax=Oncorhynchus tshawytscha TaxID=74940 RepID=UPI001C3E3C3F|nr:protocadherin beta-16-like isoform X7 [Oncorhynchus tshawytscha]
MYFLCFRGTGGSAIWKWQLYLLLSVWFHRYVDGQVRYSIPEEMTKGSFVGNIVQDLGLEVKRLKSGRARIFSEDSREYIGLNADKGTLLVKDRIDREELCAQVAPCSLHFQIILENPVELHRIDVEILDINDNSPVFPSKEIRLQISEGSLSGTRFPLENAMDPDVEMNSIQTYSLLPSDHFTLKQHSHSDGSKYLEMVLQTMLDRETNEQHILVLTAVDGGNPQKSGTVKIYIQVLDINDNAPVFSSVLYKSSLSEDTPKGTVILRVSATDSDKGTNGEVVYSFSHSTVSASDLFTVDPLTGEIKVNGKLDFETNKQHKISVQAMDRGSLTDSCKVQLDILDINDNDPVITLITFSNPIPEDASPETVIAMLNIKDLDSGRNGHIKCSVNSDLPFRIKSSSSNIYSLVTDQMLDREMVSEYNITITAVDEGFPPRSTNKTLTLRISDVNDNAPVFERHSYSAYVRENNSPGVSIFSLTASDKDTGNNARISYFIDDSHKDGLSASTFISVNSESGVIHAVRAFDYEQIKEFKICIKVQDGGSPPLSTNVTLTVFIQDQNDNAPQVLYPVQTGGSLGAEMVPRSADVGYLVTKVVAVDVDSGQNAWLSYKLQKATDRALFEVGLQNGEIRTIRQVIDKDAVKQKLTVVVEDNGQPSRSATVNVNVAVADSFPEVLSELTDFTQDKEYNNNLTFYLILALAVVSLLFIFSIISIISVKLYRWKQNKLFYKSAANLPVIPYYPPVYPDGTMETLQRVYNYEVCGTTDSRMSDVKFARPCSQNTLVDVSRMGTMQREKREQEDGDGEQKPPNNDWRFTQQGQRPGPSGQYRLVPHYSTQRSNNTGTTDRQNNGTYRYSTSTQQRWTPYGKARAGPHPEGAGGAIVGTGPWPNPPTEAEQLQALMAAANEVSEATATLGPRYNAQFPMQHVPDYRQNVYIPGSTATLTANPQQMMPQPALQGPPQAMPQVDVPNAAQTPASKKKSTKKDKK